MPLRASRQPDPKAIAHQSSTKTNSHRIVDGVTPAPTTASPRITARISSAGPVMYGSAATASYALRSNNRQFSARGSQVSQRSTPCQNAAEEILSSPPADTGAGAAAALRWRFKI